LAAAIFIVDRVTKGLVVANVPLNTEFPAVDHLVWIAHIQNSGAAFGIAPLGSRVFLLVSAVVAISLVVYEMGRRGAPLVGAMLGLILGGTVGNGYDRLLHGGSVTDFIAVHFWPVFNVADSAISIGVVVLLLGFVLRGNTRTA
jgi:signal peptidase II